MLCERNLESLLSFILELRRGVASDMIMIHGWKGGEQEERTGLEKGGSGKLSLFVWKKKEKGCEVVLLFPSALVVEPLLPKETTKDFFPYL